jgi:SAM-dependent methyltransferase
MVETISEQQYLEHYQVFNLFAEKLWENKERQDYETDVWYNHDRNRIVLEMIGDKWKGLNVLATGTGSGAAQWADNEVLDNLGAAKVTKTNFTPGKGVDIVCDACDLPFANESYDAVFCREVIEHVLNDNALLNEAHRVLKADGWFFVSTPNAFQHLPDGKHHLRAYSPQQLLDKLAFFYFETVDKRGNMPNIIVTLFPLMRSGYPYSVLEQFQALGGRWNKVKDSYYFGSELYALCRKVTA